MEKIFSERFRQARARKQITIKEVADKISVPVSTMNNYAAGKIIPPLPKAVEIARHLGVSLDWLCGLDDDAVFKHDADTPMDLLGFVHAVDQFAKIHKDVKIAAQSSDRLPSEYYVEISIKSRALFDYYSCLGEIQTIFKDLAMLSEEDKQLFIGTKKERLLQRLSEADKQSPDDLEQAIPIDLF